MLKRLRGDRGAVTEATADTKRCAPWTPRQPGSELGTEQQQMGRALVASKNHVFYLIRVSGEE
jgi:hypothetical protein